MYLLLIKKLLSVLMLSAVWLLWASDAEGNRFFAQGRDQEKASSFRKAASCYMDAHFIADSPVLRGNALIAAARAYRKAKLYGAEFDCLRKLLREHLNGINFTQVTERIYTIGDLFFAGHRDLFVDWIPFFKKDDRTYEIYEAALEAAPCFERAGETRLRVARLYIDDQKVFEAIRHLREVSKLHGGTPAGKFAMLELCSLLAQMSERGDGDNSYGKQAIEACDNYTARYGSSPENQWVLKTRQQVRNRIAERFHSTGSYYYRSGKVALAERYLANVVKDYANTKIARSSEALLSKINTESEAALQSLRVPPGEVREKFKVIPIPEEDQPILVTPEESSGKWLLPVRDLKKSSSNETAQVLQRGSYLKFSAGKDSGEADRSSKAVKGEKSK